VTTPAPPAPVEATPAARLAAAEERTAGEIDAILAGATTGAALLAAAGAITAAILAGAQIALAVGAAIALTAGRPRQRLTAQPLPSPIPDDVETLLLDAARRLDAADDRADELARTRRRLHRLAVIKIHQAASSGTFMYARAIGARLEWVTRMDGRACVLCAAMHGRTVGPGRTFAAPRGMRVWDGFRGLPPIHPWCRCRITPRRTP
jgi:hypothetical protein